MIVVLGLLTGLLDVGVKRAVSRLQALRLAVLGPLDFAGASLRDYGLSAGWSVGLTLGAVAVPRVCGLPFAAGGAIPELKVGGGGGVRSHSI